MTRPMVSDADAAEWAHDAGHEDWVSGEFTDKDFDPIALHVLALLADRERTLGLLRDSVDDQVRDEELPNGDKRRRCDMCQVVLTYWRKDAKPYEKPHNPGCLIPAWEALLKEAHDA